MNTHSQPYIKFSFIAIISLVLVSIHTLSFADSIVNVYKSPTCGCCNKWVEHLEQNGFKVKSFNVNNMDWIKNQSKVPTKLRSCHTAFIDNYTIEGHVPAKDIKKLLASQSKVKGLTVPGMPMGSPGMEGFRKDKYAVYLFDEMGNTQVVSSYH